MISFSKEPVRVAALARVCLVALAAFGFKLTPEEITSLVVAVELVASIVVRNRVSPV